MTSKLPPVPPSHENAEAPLEIKEATVRQSAQAQQDLRGGGEHDRHHTRDPAGKGKGE